MTAANTTTVSPVQEPDLARAHAQEVAEGKRFEFGKNWAAFLTTLNDDRVAIACKSLEEKLGSLRGKTFLDIGCGSGLFSLCAAKLGAARVLSFDYDPNSVHCARELKRRYFPGMDSWEIRPGSALDDAFMHGLPTSDVVYVWGVLHHTGDMWKGIRALPRLVNPGGKVFVAIYNDQGLRSHIWRAVKRVYCSGPVGKALIIALYFPFFFFLGLGFDLLMLTNPLRRYTEYKKNRGMSMTHDWYDWLGGYPFEVAKPEIIFNYFRDQGFILRHLTTAGGALGNNEFVFEKTGAG